LAAVMLRNSFWGRMLGLGFTFSSPGRYLFSVPKESVGPSEVVWPIVAPLVFSTMKFATLSRYVMGSLFSFRNFVALS
jgi:hypothetical protein